MPELAYTAVTLAAATVLVVSGTFKVAKPLPVAQTLSDLGVPVARPATTGLLIGAFELFLACAMVLARSWWAAALVATFGATLALAGLVAVATGRDVACGCFGDHAGTLGFRQIVQLPLWIAAAWCVSRSPASFGEAPVERLAMLAVPFLITAAGPVGRLWLAIQPMTRRRRQAQALRAS